MDQFPTIQDLANAPEDKLLKVWEGLGYYSRARNLQAAAKQIMEEFNGKFPTTVEDIRTLKGVGPYTAGAISSIAFEIPEPAIDGNVKRISPKPAVAIRLMRQCEKSSVTIILEISIKQ
jgi:A/G-specific adenine glycosylase